MDSILEGFIVFLIGVLFMAIIWSCCMSETVKIGRLLYHDKVYEVILLK